MELLVPTDLDGDGNISGGRTSIAEDTEVFGIRFSLVLGGEGEEGL